VPKHAPRRAANVQCGAAAPVGVRQDREPAGPAPTDRGCCRARCFSPHWRQTVRQQIVELDEVIAQAQTAQTFLTHALNCPTEHPARECATMIETLDRLVAGTPIDRIAGEHLQRPTSPADDHEIAGSGI
jgi:hypothetical protein